MPPAFKFLAMAVMAAMAARARGAPGPPLCSEDLPWAERDQFCAAAFVRTTVRGARPHARVPPRPRPPSAAPTPEPSDPRPPPLWEGCAPGTAGHLSAEAAARQPEGFPVSIDAAEGAVLPSSSSGLSLRLVKISADCSSAITVARSYDGSWGWEATTGAYGGASTAAVTALSSLACVPGGGVCTIDGSAAPWGSFRVDAAARGLTTNAAAMAADASRLLMQGTFGPTRSELQTLRAAGAGAAAAWVRDQMSTAPSSHREHFRARSNPRFVPWEVPYAGAIRKPCEPGSRWNRYALSTADSESALVMDPVGPVPTASPNQTYRILLNGIFRTLATEVLDQAGVDLRASDGLAALRREFKLCSVHEYVGGYVEVVSPSADCEWYNVVDGGPSANPALTYDAGGELPVATHVFDSGALSLGSVHIPEHHGDAVIVEQFGGSADCAIAEVDSNLTAVPTLGVRSGPAQDEVVYYRYDPRLALVENTPASPGAAEVCPVVPDGSTDAAIKLDHLALRAFHNVAGRYVYTVTGLQLDVTSAAEPCDAAITTRWVRSNGACPPGAPTAAAGTEETITAAVSRATAHASVDVVELGLGDFAAAAGTACSAALGRSVLVAGNCWTHSHADERSVFDFTAWRAHHPGGAARIEKWAADGLTELAFPPSHWDGTDRWGTYSDHPNRYIIKVGISGGTVSYGSLPAELRSEAIAAHFGVQVEASTSGCGSHGEVVNRPGLGHIYQHGDSATLEGVDTPHASENGKSMVWQNVVLSAPDQLRQRLAWALSQIFVVGTVGLDSVNDDEVEPWQNYYDIFVRHAFGNYRDIMREVSQSPMMGSYLTFVDNRAFEAEGKYPDENFARELMQLFSVGQFRVGPDGTPERDPNTDEPVAAYSNADVMSFARVWTGYDRQVFRRNIAAGREDQPSSRNHVDPMVLRPDYRDRFPKTGLGSGYLGDGYPLCSKLPDQHYLQAGSRYELIGAMSTLGSTYDQLNSVLELTPAPFVLPCGASAEGDGSIQPCPATGAAALQPKFIVAGPAYASGKNAAWVSGRALVTIPIEPTVDIGWAGWDAMKLYHRRFYDVSNGVSTITISGVHHWARRGTELSVILSAGHTLDDLNAAFSVGDTLTFAHHKWTAIREHFTPAESSGLHAALCDRDDSTGTGQCTYPPDVVLTADLACDGKVECGADTLRAVKVVDSDRVAFYQYIEPTCVRLAFYNGFEISNEMNWHSKTQCADPEVAGIAGAACCAPDSFGESALVSWNGNECLYLAEPMTYSTAAERCATVYAGGAPCPAYDFDEDFAAYLGETYVPGTGLASHASCAGNQYTWTSTSCTLQVEVVATGEINLIDQRHDDLSLGDGAAFSVRWAGGFPTVAAGCPPGCSVVATRGACLCDTTVTVAAVYTDPNTAVPDVSQIRSALPIAATNPAKIRGDLYTECTTSGCKANPMVVVHVRGSSGTPAALDTDTIFELIDAPRGAHGRVRARYLLNQVSTVRVGDPTAGFSFRNPPSFNPNAGERLRSQMQEPLSNPLLRRPHAEAEAEALLGHLFEDPNTPPFVAFGLIQRLVTSNPSPGYVGRVAEAFRTGVYAAAGRAFSGEYGDLGATVAAILLDREARSPTLDADVTFGRLEEPLLKVLRMMRSMEFVARDGADISLYKMERKVGQNAYRSPGVFNFYIREFAPKGPVTEARLVSPEAQLGTAPYMIGFLNGIVSLLNHGLSECNSGFGDVAWDRDYYGDHYTCHVTEQRTAELAAGALTFAPTAPSTPAAVVAELGELLTPAGLRYESAAVITEAYEGFLAETKLDLSGAVAVQSDTAYAPSSRYGAHKAIDGQLGGYDDDLWKDPYPCSIAAAPDGGFVENPWLEVDLGETKLINSVTVHPNGGLWHQDRLDGLEVAVLNGRPGDLPAARAGSTEGWVSKYYFREWSNRITVTPTPDELASRTPDVVRTVFALDWLRDIEPSAAIDGLINPVTGQPVTDYFESWHTTYVTAPVDGVYTFRVTSDDGSLLYVDGKEVVNNDGTHGPEMKTGTIAFTAGITYKIEVTYFERWGDHDGLLVQMVGPNGNRVAAYESGKGSFRGATTRAGALVAGCSADHGVGLPGECPSTEPECVHDGVCRPAGSRTVGSASICKANWRWKAGATPTRARCAGGALAGNIIRLRLFGPDRWLGICELEVAVAARSESGTYPPQPVAEAEALAHALKLMAITPEFHASNLHMPGPVRPAPATQVSSGRTHRAVVVVFFEGGMDSMQMVMPHSGCSKPAEAGTAGGTESHDLYAEFAAVRGAAMTLDKSRLLQVSTAGSGQPCDHFGVHPALPLLHELYKNGTATLVANMGALLEPIASKQPWYEGIAEPPAGVFGHNTMQRHAETANAADNYALGILGRMVQAVSESGGTTVPMKSALYSTAGYQRMVNGAEIAPYTVDEDDGVARFGEYAELADEIAALAGATSESVFAETHGRLVESALRDTEALGQVLDDETVSRLDTAFGESSLAKQLEKVAKLIKVANAGDMERSAFVTRMGSWDTHDTIDIDERLADVNTALSSFVEEMKSQGQWDDVVVVGVSDFGRTLSTNGEGTDHGWGGNYFLLGGGLDGGKMLGRYPARLAEDFSAENIGRGRFIPTTPWEAVWAAVSEWWGVSPDRMAEVLPNAGKFRAEQLFSESEVFKASRR